MTVHFALTSESDELLRLVAEFAQGLGCTLQPALGPSGSLRMKIPEESDMLLSLVTYVALSATKLGVDLVEPLCEISYKRGADASEVTLALRISDIRLQNPTASGV